MSLSPSTYNNTKLNSLFIITLNYMFQRESQYYFTIPPVSLCTSFFALTSKDRQNTSESLKILWAPW